MFELHVDIGAPTSSVIPATSCTGTTSVFDSIEQAVRSENATTLATRVAERVGEATSTGGLHPSSA